MLLLLLSPPIIGSYACCVMLPKVALLGILRELHKQMMEYSLKAKVALLDILRELHKQMMEYSLRMKVPFPVRLFPSILRTCKLQLARTERSSSVRVCSSKAQ